MSKPNEALKMNSKQIYYHDWGGNSEKGIVHPGCLITSHYANLLLNFLCVTARDCKTPPCLWGGQEKKTAIILSSQLHVYGQMGMEANATEKPIIVFKVL